MMRISTRMMTRLFAVLALAFVLSGTMRTGAATMTYQDIAASTTLADYLETVASDVDQFWSATLGADYDAPARFLVVEEETETGCGPLEPGFMNAYFCEFDTSIYLDVVLMEQLYEDYGEGVIAAVVAHEWGHHIQHLLGLSDGSIAASLEIQTSLQNELQADCLAGVWAADAEATGRFEPGDLDQVLLAYAIQLGDHAELPTGIHDDPLYLDQQHGDAALRVWWFLQGYQDGILSCGL